MLTPEQRDLLRRHVSIDGDGNVVGNDNTVRVTKQTAGDYAVQIGEQQITVNVAELRQVLNIQDSQVGVIGDQAHVEGGIHQHKHYHQTVTQIPLPPPNVNHIPLPPHYVPRPEVLDAARTALLESAGSRALTSAIQTTSSKAAALHGMGGIGKTVVARALCDDPQVREAFPDGILWTKLGREITDAGLRIKLREWIDALGGIVSETAPTLDRLRAILAQLLAERACLLVVDNVWRRTHAEAFQVGGPRCRLLITTRDAEIARGLGARLQPVDVLARNQAVTLVEQWAEGKLDSVHEDIKRQIVMRVGCLPLAIKLAGDQLRRHDPERWLTRFNARRLRSRRPEDVHDNLFQTLSISLDDLTDEDRRCYTALAVFPEDESIPLTALGKLWSALVGLNDDSACDLMHDLAARALVDLEENHRGLAVKLHDLLRDFITTERGEQDIRAAHRALLDTYQTTKESVGWHTAPDDGYLYDHLAYHLDALADHDREAANDLWALFADHAWLHAQWTADDPRYDGYLTDLVRAWRRGQIEASHCPLSITDCLHAALIQTTTNALAIMYEPALVARAVEIELWPPARGLSISRRIASAQRRLGMAAAVLATEKLSDRQAKELQHLGLAAMRESAPDGCKVEALTMLAPCLERELLTEALKIACTIEEEYNRARILAVLVAHLDEEARKKALVEGVNAAQSIEDEALRVKALAALTPYLKGRAREQATQEVLSTARIDGWGDSAPMMLFGGYMPLVEERAARARQDEGYRAEALAALIPHLEEESRKQTLDKIIASVRSISSEQSRSIVLTTLAPHLEGGVLTEAIATARDIENGEERAKALAALAAHTGDEQGEELIAEGLESARKTEYRGGRARALAEMASHLKGDAKQEIIREALSIIHEIENDGWGQTPALTTLAPHLESEMLRRELAAAHILNDEESQLYVFAALIPHLGGKMQQRAAREGLAAARKIGDEWCLAKAISMLSSYMEVELLTEALARIGAIKDDKEQIEALSALAPYIKNELMMEALAIVRELEYEWNCSKALAALAPYLERDSLTEALAIAYMIEGEEHKARSLAALIPQLESERQKLAAKEGVAAAQRIEEPAYRAEMLATLAQYIEGEARQQTLMEGVNIAYEIQNDEHRIIVLSALIQNLSGERKQRILTEALTSLRKFEFRDSQVKAVAVLMPYLNSEMRKQASSKALTTTRKIRHEEYRTQALVALTPHLDRDLLEEALTITCGIDQEEYRAEALSALTPYLEGDLLAKGLAMSKKIENEWFRAKTLMALVPRFKADLLAESITIARKINNESYRADVLATLSPYLEGNLLSMELEAARTIEDPSCRATSLAVLALRIMELSGAGATLLEEIREAIVQCIWDCRNQERRYLLDLLASNEAAFLRAFDLPPESYAQITQSIIDICTKWEWL